MNKQTLKTIIIIGLIAAVFVGVGYALITSNEVVITPKASGLSIEASNITPNEGDTITLTATLEGTTMSNVPVTFYINDVSIATINTVSGVATLPVEISDMTVLTCYATIP